MCVFSHVSHIYTVSPAPAGTLAEALGSCGWAIFYAKYMSDGKSQSKRFTALCQL